MSFYLTEYSTLYSRAIIVAPNTNLLKSTFAELGDHLGLALAENNEELNWRAAALKKNSPHFWLSLNLGAPLGKIHRLFLMGFDLSRAFPHEMTIEATDLALVIGPQTPTDMETLLNWQKTTSFPQVPTCLLHSTSPSFYKKAFSAWGQRHFSVQSEISSIENFVADKLEWALSF